jgi:replicative superfamily II helicase
MILYEAEFIHPKLTEILVESQDDDGLTPLYLLCELGYRRKDFKMDQDWQIRNFLEQFGVAEQLKEFINNNSGEEIFEDINLTGFATET